MTSHDFLFYVFAVTAAAAALAAAMRADLQRAVVATLVAGAALVGLLGLVAAPLAATLVGACVFAGYTAVQRRPQGAPPLLDAAAARASRLRSAALVAAFFVITLRSVLIVSWPFPHASPGPSFAGLPAVGLTHYLVLSLVLVAVGLFAALSRRTIAGVALGLASSAGGVVLALASASRFVRGGGEAAVLAAVVTVFSAAAGLATMQLEKSAGDPAHGRDAASRIAASLSATLAGVSLALLASAW